MALEYREEPRTETDVQRQMIWWAVLFVTFGFLYTWSWIFSPVAVSAGLLALQEIEGLAIITSVVLAIAAFCVLLAVCFLIPAELRLIILSVSAVAALALIGVCLEHHGVVAALSLGLFAGYSWKLRAAVLRFHREWLLSDPRLSKDGRAAWLSYSKHLNAGWIRPRLDSCCALFHRYLRYHAESSGAAGVWTPSLSSSARLGLVCRTAASLFALSTMTVSMAFSSKALGLVLGMIVAGLFAGAIAVVIFGRVAALTECFHARLCGEKKTWWQQYVDRLSESEHLSRDKITGGAVREAEHFFLGAEPWLNFPILIHEPILYDHTSIVGRTGSGKTSIGMMQLMIQVIRGHRVPEARPDNSKEEPNELE
jgi:hypothetical protein